MASYKVTPNATLQFNIYNIADKYYYDSAYSNWAVPAAGRTALTLRTELIQGAATTAAAVKACNARAACP